MDNARVWLKRCVSCRASVIANNKEAIICERIRPGSHILGNEVDRTRYTEVIYQDRPVMANLTADRYAMRLWC